VVLCDRAMPTPPLVWCKGARFASLICCRLNRLRQPLKQDGFYMLDTFPVLNGQHRISEELLSTQTWVACSCQAAVAVWICCCSAGQALQSSAFDTSLQRQSHWSDCHLPSGSPDASTDKSPTARTWTCTNHRPSVTQWRQTVRTHSGPKVRK